MSQIQLSEHVFIAGMTGGGKSYLAESYLSQLWPVLKLDTKGEAIVKLREGKELWPGVPADKLSLILQFEDLAKWDYHSRPFGIYVPGGISMLPVDMVHAMGLKEPDEDETDDPGLYGRVFRWIWDTFRMTRWGCRVWVDELKDFFDSPAKIERYMKYLYTKGRYFNLAVWGLSQEPRHLHSLTMSQATHVYAFDLARVEDRRRVADNTGAPEFLELPGGYNFWYFQRGWKNAVKGVMQG